MKFLINTNLAFVFPNSDYKAFIDFIIEIT